MEVLLQQAAEPPIFELVAKSNRFYVLWLVRPDRTSGAGTAKRKASTQPPHQAALCHYAQGVAVIFGPRAEDLS
jgi:hypothetical protein